MKSAICKEFIKNLPKAELHVHIEGTMEPAQMQMLAQRNGMALPPHTLDASGTRYAFNDYDSFIDTYIQATNVLQYEQDFYDVTWAYLEKIAQQGVLHAEIFFDLQTYLPRGIAPGTVINGIYNALVDGNTKLGISGKLIMCIIRHLPEEDGFKALKEAKPYRDKIVGIGLASTENGNPPSKFERVFAQARREGYHIVAHVAEECDGGADKIRQALSLLHAERIDHGIGCMTDPVLVQELVRKKIPLTVCPFSNVALKLFKDIKDHPLKRMFESGLRISINSDDPAFFKGYIADNYLAATKHLDFSCQQLVTVARYSFQDSFLDAISKKRYLAVLEAYANGHVCR